MTDIDNLDFDSLRHQLLNVEAEIKKIAGSTPGYPNKGAFRRPECIEAIGKLLNDRCGLLNRMLIGTTNELEHLKKVNQHFLDLRINLQCRILELSWVEKSLWFDDDRVIEGTIHLPYNDETSVLKLEEDSLYGSDFDMMLCVLEYYYDAIGRGNVGSDVDLSSLHRPDDGVTMDRRPFSDKMFEGLPLISEALHDLCWHKDYSIPDVIRLNDFWAEAKLVAQSITTQKGKRVKFDS